MGFARRPELTARIKFLTKTRREFLCSSTFVGLPRLTPLHSFDPASLAILDRLNRVISLLQNNSRHLNDAPHSAVSPFSQPANADIVQPTTPSISFPGTAASTAAPTPRSLSFRVVTWRIFDDCPVDKDPRALFIRNSQGTGSEIAPPQSVGIIEDQVPLYVRSFLANVNPKNPVLDHVTLTRYARQIAENGLSWDAYTGLVVSVQYLAWRLSN